MKVLADLTAQFFQIFPTLPRTVMLDTEANQVFVHTGHCYLASVEPVSTLIASETPTPEELNEFAKAFRATVRDRSVYSFATHLAVIQPTDEPRYSLLSVPVLLMRGQPTPTVRYRGANGLPLPQYATTSSVGFDILADREVTIEPGKRATVATGLFLDAGEWDRNSPCYLRVAPTSGNAVKKGLDVLAGVVDADYPAEIGVVLINHDDVAHTFKVGDKVAQGIWEIAIQGGNLPVAQQARIGGFGSTEKR